MTFCSDAGQRDELLRRFSSLEIGDVAQPSTPASTASSAAPAVSRGKPSKTPTVDSAAPLLPAGANDASARALSDIMMALRKLREGIVASKRADDFAIQAYLFCIRLSILVKQPESYHPAILHLLRAIHPLQPLTSLELHDVVAYLVLDTACRRRELAEAFALRLRYGLRDAKVNAVLAALVHDDYVAFRRVKRGVDGHRAKVMEWAEADVRMHTLKCFGRTYMSVGLEFLEATTGSTWDDLRRDDGVGWELDDSRVVIRKVKAR